MNQCPNIKCGSDDIRVINSRAKGNYIWRRRRCGKCETTFSTYEITETEWKQLEHLEKDYVNSFKEYYNRLSAKEQLRIIDKLAD